LGARQRYTEFVFKKVTVTLSEEAARWVSEQAAERKTSVSKFVGRLIEEKMRQTDDYWRAYEAIKKIEPIPGFDASKRGTRDEIYERRRPADRDEGSGGGPGNSIGPPMNAD
jgi:hypothetical protein